MCQQFIGIAQCAPTNPLTCALAFQCGQLHHYAAHRENCVDAKGNCLCFFGTCGAIENVVRPQTFDLLSLPKIRCLPCTTREEQMWERRHGRDFLETQLLTRLPVEEEGMPDHAKMLMDCWGGQTECPFHDISDDGSSKAASVTGTVEEKSVHDNDVAANDFTGTRDLGSSERPISVKSTDDSNIPRVNNDEQNNDIQHKVELDDTTGFTTAVKQQPASPKDSANALENIAAYTRDASKTSIKDLDEPILTKTILGIEASRWAPAGTARKESVSPERRVQEEDQAPTSSPRPEMIKTPKIEPGKTALSGIAKDMKSFLRL